MLVYAFIEVQILKFYFLLLLSLVLGTIKENQMLLLAVPTQDVVWSEVKLPSS